MFDAYDADREREDALANENAPMSMHMAEYTRNHGALRPDAAWILAADGANWEANPHFVGPRPPHPESCEEEIDAWFAAHPPVPTPPTVEEQLAEYFDKHERPTPFW